MDARRAPPGGDPVIRAGAAWLAWLPSDDATNLCTKATAQFPALRQKWINYLHAHQASTVNPARVATNLDTNQLTWWMLAHHPQIGAFAQQYSQTYLHGLGKVATEMARLTAEALEAYRFLETLSEIIASGSCVLLKAFVEPSSSNRDRFIGWCGDDHSVFLLPDMARMAVEKVLGPADLNNMSNMALYSQLAGLDLIQSSDNGRHTRNIRVSPTRVVRTLHLKPAALKMSE